MNSLLNQQTTPTADGIDDCWNRIGVRGDASCPQLVQHIDCRNCPVHARAATELLDRLQTEELPPSLDQLADDQQPDDEHDRADLTSLLLFRIGDEWLALPTVLFEEVSELRPVHGLPHRKNAIVLGIANIRGALVTCVSLGAMLGIAGEDQRAKSHEAGARMLVVRRNGQATAFSADEVVGTLRIAASAHRPLPTTLTTQVRGAGHFSHAVIRWNDRSVGLLDEDLLFHTLDRSLA